MPNYFIITYSSVYLVFHVVVYWRGEEGKDRAEKGKIMNVWEKKEEKKQRDLLCISSDLRVLWRGAPSFITAAVQTTAVVKLIQTLCFLQTQHLSGEDMQRFTELLHLDFTCYIHNWKLLHNRPKSIKAVNLKEKTSSEVRASCPSAKPLEGSAQHD